MQIKIDPSVLRKTDIFREILDDANRRKNIEVDLKTGILREYKHSVDPEEQTAADRFADLGVCLRGDLVVKRHEYKTPDLITGGFQTESQQETVYLAECKFNAENPGNLFGKSKDFHERVADKFRVVDADIWNIYAPGKKFFVLFPHKNSEQTKARMRALQRASEGEELRLAKLFTVCNLTEFSAFFARPEATSGSGNKR